MESQLVKMELVQSPVIKHALKEWGKKVDDRLSALDIEKQVVNEDTIQYLKKLLAELNKELKDFESDRKDLKQAVASPYMEFEDTYKVEIKERYDKSILTLKDRVGAYEIKLKEAKRKEVIEYFDELIIAEKVDFVKFADLGINVGLSDSMKSLKDKCNTFVSKINDDIKLINTMEHSAEIMAEYKVNSFNASLAVTSINSRKEREKLELEREKQAEIDSRQGLLRGMAMAYHDMTKSFHYAGSDDIFITSAEISSLKKEDFDKVFVQIESKIKAFKAAKLKKEEEAAAQLKLQQEQSVGATMDFSEELQAPQKEVTPEPVKEPEPLKPLSAPVVEEQKEQEFTASFEVTGTMTELMALKNYLIENNLTYKNID